MDQRHDTPLAPSKFYSEKALSLGIFIGGPLTAGYFFAQNFKALGEPGKAKKSWMIAFLATVVIFGGSVLIPDDVKIPNQLIPFIYTAIAALLFQQYQGKRIAALLPSKSQFYSLWRAAGIGIIGITVTLLPILGISLMIDQLNATPYSSLHYGRLGHEISFDNSNITVQEVNKIADALVETGFFDQALAKYVHLHKKNEGYELSIFVRAGIENNPEALQPFRELRADVQSLFPRHTIVFKLVADDLTYTVKILK